MDKFFRTLSIINRVFQALIGIGCFAFGVYNGVRCLFAGLLIPAVAMAIIAILGLGVMYPVAASELAKILRNK